MMAKSGPVLRRRAAPSRSTSAMPYRRRDTVHPLVRTSDSAPHELENTVMTAQRSVVLYEPVRTAIGTFGGSLKDMPAPDLGAVAIKAAVARAGLQPEAVATAMMGNVIQAGVKMNPARQAAIGAGLPVTIPAMTIN